MLKKIFISFILAFHNIRSHFFHTMLSVLGIVIGVAALVAILSMIDGMEQYARDQISSTTSLKTINITADAFKRSNGISIRKDSVTALSFPDFLELRSALTYPAKSYLFQRQAKEIRFEGDTLKTGAHATGVIGLDTAEAILAGRAFSESEILNRSEVALLTESLAQTLADENELKALLGRKIIFGDRSLTVIGIIFLKYAQGHELFFPFTLLTARELRNNPPHCMLEAENIEDVPKLKDQVTVFLNNRFSGRHDYTISTNDFRVEQAAKGFQLFRIIMGLIVGISVLVGGIGVMNVLLISVTERTSEIGVRKAVGANKRDIILQFLSESITISFFGSMLGLALGILSTMIIVPVIKSLTKIPFQAAYTWNTFIVISILAVGVGVIFGTYPAIRAAKLDPVEAIRRNE
jgi:putative ABC transport system permease protein